jgi:hypothetical protein
VKILLADPKSGTSQIDVISHEIGLFQEVVARDLLQIVDKIGNCDAILVPHDAYFFHGDSDYVSYINKLSKFKPIIYSDRGDFPKKTRIRNSVAIRVAINPGENSNRKIVIPYNVESLSSLPMRRYTSNPSVSFVGYLPKVSLGRIQKSILQTPFHPISGNGAIVRRKSLRQLKNSDLDSQITERTTYGAHPKTNLNVSETRDQYLETMTRSDFVLAPRGDANQSARFYEALSAGRIPIVPNTRIKLPIPLSNTKIGKLHTLTIQLSKSNDMENSVTEFWRTLDDAKYMQIQDELRLYFQEEFNFNTYVRRLFNLDFEMFLKLAHN